MEINTKLYFKSHDLTPHPEATEKFNIIKCVL